MRVAFSYHPASQEVRIYLNGTLLGSAIASKIARPGGYVWARGNAAFTVADVAVYNRMLIISEIVHDYTAGVLPDAPIAR